MEIGWVGILTLVVAWFCMAVATGFAFYVHTKDKDYEMEKKDKDYLLVASVLSAVAVGLSTVVVLLVIFFGKEKYKEHVKLANQLMLEKLELENQVNDMDARLEQHRRERHPSVLENPLPLRRGNRGRPLIT